MKRLRSVKRLRSDSWPSIFSFSVASCFIAARCVAFGSESSLLVHMARWRAFRLGVDILFSDRWLPLPSDGSDTGAPATSPSPSISNPVAASMPSLIALKTPPKKPPDASSALDGAAAASALGAAAAAVAFSALDEEAAAFCAQADDE